MLRRFVVVFFVAALLLASASNGFSQWVSDSTTNTPVCVLASSSQGNPQVCTDGADGAIVVWEDSRNGGSFLIYAQHLGADGKPKWTLNGIRLDATANANQRYPIIAPDNKGGAYVVWQDYRNSTRGIDLYSQHVTSAGLTTYDSAGRIVCTDPADQTNPQITADGFGNAYVVWEDNRSSVNETNPDLYINRLTPSKVQWTSDGVLLSGQASKQRRAQLCEDGVGGCVVAWESTATNPISIYGQRVDSNQKMLWTTPYGIDLFQLTNGLQSAKNVNIRRDGNQIMMAWEVTNVSSSNGQDIFANRITLTGSKLFPSAIQVVTDWPGDQKNPQVFSDDSAEAGFSGNSGLLVFFEDAYSATPQAVKLVRIFADGNTIQPLPNKGFYQVSYASGAENGFKALRVSPGSILTVWNDARGDSTIYCQRVDRVLQRDFPTVHTASTWGEPLCARLTTQSKQVAIAPRTNGAIAVWTDYRNGNPDIYAQLVFSDGSLPVELETFQAQCRHTGEVDLLWKTASEKGNAGFEIERRPVDNPPSTSRGGAGGGEFATIASYIHDYALRGALNSNFEHSYSFADRNIDPAIYEYRLVEVGMDGTHTTHNPVRVDARSGENVADWSLGPNMPNPFVDRTNILVSLPVEAIVDLTVFDVTGRTVVNPIPHQLLTNGSHEIALDANALGGSNGSFLVRMIAYDPLTGQMLWRSEEPLMIARVK